MVVGFAFLLSLPSPIRSHFLGGSPAATAELAAGILLAIAAFIAATHATHAADPERGVIAGSTLLGATLLAMILLREQLAAAPVPVDPAIVRSETLGAAEPVFLAAALMIIAGGMSRWILRRLAALPAGRADRATPGAPSQRPTGSAEPS
jgi:hypothetical protein